MAEQLAAADASPPSDPWERANLVAMRRAWVHAAAVPADLVESLKRVVELWRPVLEKSGLKVLLEAAKPVRAVFDADAVEQILGNLLSNVEKYAAGSELTIRVQDDGSVEVHDRGPGIAAKDAARIFEPFYRSRNDLTEGVSGTASITVLQVPVASVVIDNRTPTVRQGGTAQLNALALDAIGRDIDQVAQFAKPLDQEVREPLLVLDNQDGLHARVFARGVRCFRRGGLSVVSHSDF